MQNIEQTFMQHTDQEGAFVEEKQVEKKDEFGGYDPNAPNNPTN